MSIRTQFPVEDSDTDIRLTNRREPGDWPKSTPNAARTLYTFAVTMNDALDLNTIVNLALKTTMDFSDMDAVVALLLDPLTNELSLQAHLGGLPELVRIGDRIKIHWGMMPRMLTAVLTTNDITEVTGIRRLALEREGLRSLLSIPLLSSVHPQGVMILASHQERTFLSEEIELFAIMGRHIGSAIYRANLQSQELRAAILEERQAMARQMHDDIAQTLGYLGLQVDEIMDRPDLAEREGVQAALEAVRSVIEKSYQRVRDSIVRLSQDIPNHFDLRVALRQIIEEFTESTGCRVKMSTDVDWIAPLPPLVAIQASHIIQEALTNVQKYARANTVSLSLQRLNCERIEIVIQDDGRGFDVALVPQTGESGLGLRFMAERAERVGGTFEIKSQPGQGTQIVVCLPAR